MNLNNPTSNRFDPLGGGEMASTWNSVNMASRIEQTNLEARQGFATSSMDDKMLMMFDKLTHISAEQIVCSRTMVHSEQTLNKMADKIGKVIDVTNTQSSLLKTLAYTSIDIESRSRRNN